MDKIHIKFLSLSSGIISSQQSCREGGQQPGFPAVESALGSILCFELPQLLLRLLAASLLLVPSAAFSFLRFTTLPYLGFGLLRFFALRSVCVVCLWRERSFFPESCSPFLTPRSTSSPQLQQLLLLLHLCLLHPLFRRSSALPSFEVSPSRRGGRRLGNLPQVLSAPLSLFSPLFFSLRQTPAPNNHDIFKLRSAAVAHLADFHSASRR